MQGLLDSGSGTTKSRDDAKTRRDVTAARVQATREALAAFRELSLLEGIIPALETAHALAWVLAQQDGALDLVCLSGRGDKDLAQVLGSGEA